MTNGQIINDTFLLINKIFSEDLERRYSFVLRAIEKWENLNS